MRVRGALTTFAATGAEGATATDSIAACICSRLRRQYAITITTFARGPRTRPANLLPKCFSGEAAAMAGAETLDFCNWGNTNQTPTRNPPIQSDAALLAMFRARHVPLEPSK